MSASDVLQLPLREKLQIMEIIWNDLRAKADQSAILQEHKILLDERRKRVASGNAKLVDWEQVKKFIG